MTEFNEIKNLIESDESEAATFLNILVAHLDSGLEDVSADKNGLHLLNESEDLALVIPDKEDLSETYFSYLKTGRGSVTHETLEICVYEFDSLYRILRWLDERSLLRWD